MKKWLIFGIFWLLWQIPFAASPELVEARWWTNKTMDKNCGRSGCTVYEHKDNLPRHDYPSGPSWGPIWNLDMSCWPFGCSRREVIIVQQPQPQPQPQIIVVQPAPPPQVVYAPQPIQPRQEICPTTCVYVSGGSRDARLAVIRALQRHSYTVLDSPNDQAYTINVYDRVLGDPTAVIDLEMVDNYSRQIKSTSEGRARFRGGALNQIDAIAKAADEAVDKL